MPVTVANRLNSLMSNFLWGGDSKKSKIHWVRWDLLCKPYSLGRLGIANLDIMNRAFLSKWYRRYGNEPSCLWRRVVSNKIPGKGSGYYLPLHPIDIHPGYGNGL
ncbi:hypothetical protein V6N11_033287 [Hibiscus sabdariffa]|uniref:Uncharacterized protein n=1 Tax=Hibiscus sabdariffa TaxID=183260 RepID=A0ABR2PY10_9ROSI